MLFARSPDHPLAAVVAGFEAWERTGAAEAGEPTAVVVLPVVVVPGVVPPLAGASFLRSACKRPVIEWTKRLTVTRSSSVSAADADDPTCIVSSRRA